MDIILLLVIWLPPEIVALILLVNMALLTAPVTVMERKKIAVRHFARVS